MSVRIEDVRDIKVVDYLKSLGFVPAKPFREGERYRWYLSPLHDEKTPSFKVDTQTNWWVDYGMEGAKGSGHVFLNGRVIEFGMAYFNCDLPTFLSKLTVGDFSFQKPLQSSKNHEPAEPQIVVTSERSLYRYVLLNYLRERRISIEVADMFCKEVNYRMYGKDYYGIGFKNNSGGYEIRNKNFKGSCTPKDIWTIDNGSSECVTVEGGFELLTFVTIHGIEVSKEYNFCILNGAAMLNRALPFLNQHEKVLMYLNTDATGIKYRDKALELNDKSNPRFIDQSALYAPCNDLNAWHCAYGSSRSQRRGITP